MRCETFFTIIMSAFCYSNWRPEYLLKQIFNLLQNFESFWFLNVYFFSPRQIEHVKSSIFIFRLIVWNCFVKRMWRLSNYLTKFWQFLLILRLFLIQLFGIYEYIRRCFLFKNSLVQIIINNLGSSSCTAWTSIVQGQNSMLMNLIKFKLT